MKKSLIFFLLITFTLPQSNLKTISSSLIHLEYEDEYLEILNMGCGIECAAGFNITSTSTLKSIGKNNYGTKNLTDENLSSAWVEGSKDYGIGEKLIIEMGVPKEIKDLPLDGFEIVNGYTKSKKTWKNNSRIKTLKIYHNSEPKYLVQLIDTSNPQSFGLEEPLKLNYGDKIVLEIVDVYKGLKYKDTAISQIKINGAH